MYKAFYIFCSILIFGFAEKQHDDFFIGQITYEYSYSSNILDIDSLAKLKPRIGIFRYDLENYQSQFIGSDTITYYYKSDINKAVWKNKDKEEFECEDYGIPTDSIITFKIYPTKEKIQGQEVEVLEYQSKYYWTRYYVSKALKISPKTYKDHLAYNMSFYGDKTEGGLILKLEHRFENYSMHGDLLELKRYKTNFIAIEINKNEIINTCNNN